MRSEPGKGRSVEIHYLFSLVANQPSTWWSSVDEDYSASKLPLVVKIDPLFPKTDAARHLRELADELGRQARNAGYTGHQNR